MQEQRKKEEGKRKYEIQNKEGNRKRGKDEGGRRKEERREEKELMTEEGNERREKDLERRWEVEGRGRRRDKRK